MVESAIEARYVVGYRISLHAREKFNRERLDQTNLGTVVYLGNIFHSTHHFNHGRRSDNIYIDGGHATHTNAKGHSGLYAKMVKGAMINVSKKLGLYRSYRTCYHIALLLDAFPRHCELN